MGGKKWSLDGFFGVFGCGPLDSEGTNWTEKSVFKTDFSGYLGVDPWTVRVQIGRAFNVFKTDFSGIWVWTPGQ